ncbi:hypothetical protein GCM10011579_070270 [Streptomyces albiflavescens]|uniref:Uncharacterized protein n=2 Tax=Streptomyces albiflavescens TaxID=1623582 RepID=A0A917YB43_9ACTN|nr:hypothetical protein GCM10011579_070270 [Streptomyces albiflavescens]
MAGDWHFALGLAEGVVLGLAAAVGIAAVRGGRIPGWERRPVVRRRLWGQGVLVMTGSLALPAVALSALGPGALQFTVTLVGGAGTITGGALMQRASRDRRRPGGPASGPTSPAS